MTLLHLLYNKTRQNESWLNLHIMYVVAVIDLKGGGPRVAVSTAAFHARVRGSVPGLGGLKETKL